MNVAGRVGIATAGMAASAGAVGLGMHAANKTMERRIDEEVATLDKDLDKATDEWTSWNGKLEAEFPGRGLDTPQDHARFDQFLAANPAPAWVNVEHEGFTKAKVSTDGAPRSKDAFKPDDTGGQGNVYMIGFGGAFVLGGAGAGIAAMKGSPKAALLGGLGGGAAAAFGVGSIVAGFAAGKAEGNEAQKGMDALTDEVNGTK